MGVVVFSDHGADGAGFPTLQPGEVLTIGPGKVVDVHGALQWIVPDGMPPMLAIVRASFIGLRHGRPVVTAEPMVMVLQSKTGASGNTGASSTTDAELAASVAAGLRAIKGVRSPGLEDLIRSVEAIAYRAPDMAGT